MEDLANAPRSSGFDCHRQGLTRGWEDAYVRGLDCQWFDITGVPAGTYHLRISVNLERHLRESNYRNNTLVVPIRLYRYGRTLNIGIEIDYNTIMHPHVVGDQLEAIYINMDSHVLKSHKSRIKAITEEQMKLADKKYISSVYFHTLFLFATAKSKQYSVKQREQEKDLSDFLKDIFAGSYSEFLLNFGTEQLMASLDI